MKDIVEEDGDELFNTSRHPALAAKLIDALALSLSLSETDIGDKLLAALRLLHDDAAQTPALSSLAPRRH